MLKRTPWILVFSLAALAAIAAVAAVPPTLSKTLEAQRRLAAERPQDPAVYNDLGNLLLLVPQPAEAEAAYRRAVELDPDKVTALFNLGLLLQQRGEMKEASKLFRHLVEVEPRHAWAHYQSGTIYEHWGQEANAIAAYSKAFAIDPQLTFSEVNPHILDNKLVMQSVLRAYRDEGSLPQAPTVYDDPARIANLLVPPAAAAKDQVADQADPAARQQPAVRGQQPTVLREKDLDRSAAGQASPGGRGSSGRPGSAQANPPRGLRQWSRPDPVADPEGVGATSGEDVIEQPGAVIAPPPGGVYYRPGIQSTGRLNIQVVPDRKDAREGRG